MLPVDREKWIAEAAYYRAEKRGFAPGYALEDWLAAEALIDFEIARLLTQLPPPARRARGRDPEPE
jgi:hypothetical protein